MSRKSTVKDGDKPSWMVAAEERLNAAEQEKKSGRPNKNEKVNSNNQSKYSSRLSSMGNNQIDTAKNSDKPGWMLAAENRLKEEEAEKESKKKEKRSSVHSTSASSSVPISFTKSNGQRDFLTLPPEIETKVLPQQHAITPMSSTSNSIDNLMPKEEEERIEQNYKDELSRLNDKIKSRQSEFESEQYYSNIIVDTTIEDAEINQIMKESELRQKKFLEKIEAAKQRMRESCELASVNRENYVNERSKVPVFFTSTDDDDDDDNDDEDADAGKLDSTFDHWGTDSSNLKDHQVASSSSTSSSSGSGRRPFEEMKADFFNNLDRLAKEVTSAKEEHLKTLSDMHKLNLSKLAQN
jgi:hypothetical protein